MSKPSIAVHKFSSCDGCQLAFLNAGEDLLTLSNLVEIRHFAEAGPVDDNAVVDIAFIEGSVATPDDEERLKKIRNNSNYVVTIGACATSGGVQALRNMADTEQWIAGIYAHPEYIRSLDNSTPIREHIKVDLEIWGCPVNGRQIFTAVRSLLFGVVPVEEHDKVCMECKRQQNVCVMVTKGEPCMGPVTRTGCGAICPSFGRDCYACYGPAENINSHGLANRLQGLGLTNADVARHFLFINSAAEPFYKEGMNWKKDS